MCSSILKTKSKSTKFNMPKGIQLGIRIWSDGSSDSKPHDFSPLHYLLIHTHTHTLGETFFGTDLSIENFWFNLTSSDY